MRGAYMARNTGNQTSSPDQGRYQHPLQSLLATWSWQLVLECMQLIGILMSIAYLQASLSCRQQAFLHLLC